MSGLPPPADLASRTAHTLPLAEGTILHRFYTRTDGVRLFEAVCRGLNDIPQLLLTGTPDAIAAFERHASAQMPGIARRIIGVQSVVKPTNRRLAALARWHFTAPPTCADVTA